ncbi:Hypothetical protein A7982_07874 [Minicystis rosea]|nr:Hypothetical protein A7982_07874 [Minicystis rosea]
MATDTRPRPALVIEAIVTGTFLGLTQTALGFALLAGAGASALLFFALTAAWIAGGVIASAILVPRARAHTGARLLAVVLVALGLARVALARWPFHPLVSAVGLIAGLCAGGYAGLFLGTRAAAWGEPRPLLLHENNGFIAGIAVGGGLLFVSTRALDVVAGALGIALLTWSAGRR